MDLHSDNVVDCLSPGDHVYLNFAYIYTFLIPQNITHELTSACFVLDGAKQL